MIASILKEKSALQNHVPHTASTPKECLMMVSVVIGGGKSISNSNIILKTSVNGVCEKAKFLNYKSVEVNVTEGKITYDPLPSFCLSKHEPSPLAEPTFSTPLAEPGPLTSPAIFNRPNPLEPPT